MGWVLPTVLGIALIGTALLGMLTWRLLGSPNPATAKPDVTDVIEALKLVLAVTAGFGAVIALVVAFRRQRYNEIADHRAENADRREHTRLLSERFDRAVEQLGHDSPAVRLGGVHALATVADDWDEFEPRQMCIDVLCSYLRMPYRTEPPAEEFPDENAIWLGMREVRHTILRLIAAHLREDGAIRKWTGHDFDLNGVIVDLYLDFSGAEFSEGTVSFYGAVFSGRKVRFDEATFTGGEVNFSAARFTDSGVTFDGADFDGGEVVFYNTEFGARQVSFRDAVLSSGTVTFDGSTFSEGEVSFRDALFSGCEVSFMGVVFSNGQVSFRGAVFSDGLVTFDPHRGNDPPSGVVPNEGGQWRFNPLLDSA